MLCCVRFFDCWCCCCAVPLVMCCFVLLACVCCWLCCDADVSLGVATFSLFIGCVVMVLACCVVFAMC